MKKKFIIISVCLMAILALTLTACGDDKNGTYFPPNNEIETNLENAGYATCFAEVEIGWGGYAINDDESEYIYIYRLKTEEACEQYYKICEANCVNYDVIVKIVNDKKFGNIVYCGTEQAIKDAGIKIVDVKVKV